MCILRGETESQNGCHRPSKLELRSNPGGLTPAPRLFWSPSQFTCSSLCYQVKDHFLCIVTETFSLQAVQRSFCFTFYQTINMSFGELITGQSFIYFVPFFLDLLFCVGVRPANNAVMVSGEQWRDSSHACTCVYSQTPLPARLPHSTEQMWAISRSLLVIQLEYRRLCVCRTLTSSPPRILPLGATSSFCTFTQSAYVLALSSLPDARAWLWLTHWLRTLYNSTQVSQRATAAVLSFPGESLSMRCSLSTTVPTLGWFKPETGFLTSRKMSCAGWSVMPS